MFLEIWRYKDPANVLKCNYGGTGSQEQALGGIVKPIIKMSTVTFGAAIEAVKEGKNIQRAGWNGKNMFVYLNPGNVDREEGKEAGLINGVSPNLFGVGQEGTVTRMPNLNMKAADGSTVTGWLASQTDILAEDWTIIEN